MRDIFYMAVTTFALAFVAVLTGFIGRADSRAAPVSFVTDYSPVSFTFPSGWKKDTGDHPYELKATSQSSEMLTGVFVFKAIEFEDEKRPFDVFVLQIDDLLSKRQNVQELEAMKETAYPDKTVTSVSYSAYKDSSRNYYQFSLIEFAGDDSRFVYMVQMDAGAIGLGYTFRPWRSDIDDFEQGKSWWRFW